MDWAELEGRSETCRENGEGRGMANSWGGDGVTEGIDWQVVRVLGTSVKWL